MNVTSQQTNEQRECAVIRVADGVRFRLFHTEASSYFGNGKQCSGADVRY